MSQQFPNNVLKTAEVDKVQNDNYFARQDSLKEGLVSVASTYSKQLNNGGSAQVMWGFSNSANTSNGSNTL